MLEQQRIDNMNYSTHYRGKVCRKAYKLASRLERNMESYSNIIDPVNEESITRFDRNELILGDLLGKGGFNEVFALDDIDLFGSDYLTLCTQQQTQRKKMTRTCSRTKAYAVKILRYDMINDMEQYCNGAADIVLETKILANMKPHRNIIGLHGISAAGLSGLEEDVEGSYFLILDRLNSTLADRIKIWKDKRNNNLQMRLRVASELSSALAHVHKHNIIFRDLKPDNVGFDKDGTLKVFDFGLAKELNPAQRLAKDQYKMSGETGSIRYMAPEVVLSKPYGLSADIFSFAILFWEILSLEESFVGMTIKEHREQVVVGCGRPKLSKDWPDKVNKILQWSWHPDQSMRPSFKDIKKALKKEILRQEEQPVHMINAEELSSNEQSYKYLPKTDRQCSCGEKQITIEDVITSLKPPLIRQHSYPKKRVENPLFLTRQDNDALSFTLVSALQQVSDSRRLTLP